MPEITEITKPMFLDETGEKIYEQLKMQNALLSAMAAPKVTELTSDLRGIQNLVWDGLAPKILAPGDQLNVDWSDGSKTYTVPNDIVHHSNVELKNGCKTSGMYLQWHFCSPFGMPFDAAEAFYYAEEELPAGTYNIIVGDNWGNNCKKGEQYQFTLTKPVPTGGQLTGFTGMPDQVPANWRVRSYTDANSTTPIEEVKPTAGTEGTNLGTLSFTGDGKLNSMQRVAYGYGRWSQSTVRQYLNSAESAGKWWKPQNKWDRPPAEAATRPGFLSGFSEEFLAVIKPVKVRTALNTVTDSADGTYEDTYDRFFLPSLEEEFINPQLSGVEGETWDYWKAAVERSTLTPWYKNYVDGGHPITYAIDNKTSAQYVRLRSASRGYAGTAWSVNPSGFVNGIYAADAYRFAPACVIAKSQESPVPTDTGVEG